MASRVYVGNLPAGIREEELSSEFRKYGAVRSIWIARKPPGFAFVEMEDNRDMDVAVRRLDGFHGWRVEVSRGRGGGGGGGGGGMGGGGAMYGRDRYDAPRRRSPSPPPRRRSPSYDRYARRRSPSYERRRSPSYDRKRRSRTRSRSPVAKRSPSPAPRRASPEERRRTRSPSPVAKRSRSRTPPRRSLSPKSKSPRD